MTPEQKAKKAAYMKQYRLGRKVTETPERLAQKREYIRLYRQSPAGKAYYHQYNRAETTKARKRRAEIKKVYGITLQEYDERVAEQSNLCAICRRPPTPGRRLSIDHNHLTGHVRGLLCQRCNVAVAVLEYPDLGALQTYLQKWASLHQSDPLKV